MLSADGRLEIGSGGGSGLVSRRSERAEIPARIEALEGQAEACRLEIVALDGRQVDTRESLGAARVRTANEAAAVAASGADLARLRSEVVSKETAIAAAEATLRGETSRLEGVRERLQRARHEEHESQTAAVTAAEAVAAAEANAEAFDRSRGEAIEIAARLRVEAETRRHQWLAAAATLEARRADGRSAADAVEATAGRLLAIDQRRRHRDLEWLARSADFAEHCWRAERLAVRRSAVETTRDRLAGERLAVAAAAEQARDAIASLCSSLHEVELAAGEVRHRRERIVERIRDEYGLDIDADFR